jgi:hypothetical protein
MSSFIYSELPFDIKGIILSFIGNYVFRKGRINEIFIRRIPIEKKEEMREIITKIPRIYSWNMITNDNEKIWRVYIEFSSKDRDYIWKIIRQNYEYKEEDVRKKTSRIICYYEKYYSSMHIYQTPIK